MIFEITRKKLFLFGSFVVVMLAIPLTVYLSQRQQETRSSAAVVPENAVIVKISGVDVLKKDIREVAEEQYEPSAVDNQALKDSLEVVIERQILDIESDRLGVEASAAEVQELMTQDELSENEARYEVLKGKVSIAAIRSRKVISLGFWTPASADQASLSKAEKDLAKNLSNQGGAVLSEIETKLRANQNLVAVADAIVLKYPVFKDYLAINGHRVNGLTTEEKQAFAREDIVEFGDSNMDNSILNGVFAMPVGQVKKFQNTKTNSGGSVFKVIEKGNDSGKVTYAAWLKERTDALVIRVTPL